MMIIDEGLQKNRVQRRHHHHRRRTPPGVFHFTTKPGPLPVFDLRHILVTCDGSIHLHASTCTGQMSSDDADPFTRETATSCCATACGTIASNRRLQATRDHFRDMAAEDDRCKCGA